MSQHEQADERGEWEVHVTFEDDAYGTGLYEADEGDECFFVDATDRDDAIETVKDESEWPILVFDAVYAPSMGEGR